MTTPSNTEKENSTKMPTDCQEYPTQKPPKKPKMNCELYYALITYLEQWELPPHIDKWTTLTVQCEFKNFETDQQTLYKITKKQRLLVIPEHQKNDMIRLTHEKRH